MVHLDQSLKIGINQSELLISEMLKAKGTPQAFLVNGIWVMPMNLSLLDMVLMSFGILFSNDMWPFHQKILKHIQMI